MALTCADEHAIKLYLSMMLIEARRLPTRDARVTFMTGQRFSGPHHYLTGDTVVVSREDAEYAADLIEARERVDLTVATPSSAPPSLARDG